MSESMTPTVVRRHRPVGATVWFLWMIAMWVAFFVLLFADKLEGLWSAIRDLPLLLEMVVWVVFLPWVLGTAVWTSSWSTGLRVFLVACFAIGWTIVSIPREKRTAESRG